MALFLRQYLYSWRQKSVNFQKLICPSLPLLSVVTSHLILEPEGEPLDWKSLIIEGGGTRRHFLLVEITLLLFYLFVYLFLPNSTFIFLRADWGCYSLCGVARGQGRSILDLPKSSFRFFYFTSYGKTRPTQWNIFLFFKCLFPVLAFICFLYVQGLGDWRRSKKRILAFQVRRSGFVTREWKSETGKNKKGTEKRKGENLETDLCLKYFVPNQVLSESWAPDSPCTQTLHKRLYD